MKHEDWYGCYAGGWQAAPLVPEAYAHPAKVSFTLADRIYRHMLAGGWLEPGDVVVDPFGGVGGFAFHAALYGMHWQGVELEQKFVDLGNQNLDLWRDRYAPHFPNYGTARLVQGDSRRLVDVVTGAGGVVSSPPYAESVKGDMGSSWAEDDKRKPTSEHARTYSDMRLGKSAMGDYGSTPGQLGAMPAGAVVTSPPFQESIGNDKRVGNAATYTGHRVDTYAPSAGNLGNMPAGVVTSPPYEGCDLGGGGGILTRDPKMRTSHGFTVEDGNYTTDKGNGNIGNDTGDTFWSAAATIVAQCYAILRPGGYAAFVTGDFVRNKQRVPFGEQWLALCESVGFEPVLWAVAHKDEYQGTQTSMFGDDVELTKTKVSFFRRLANRNNPDAAITNEDVLFVRKPQSPRC